MSGLAPGAPGSGRPGGEDRSGTGLEERAFRVLLLAYPARFRRRFGDEMWRVHRRRRLAVEEEGGGTTAAALFLAREAAGLLCSGLRARFRSLRGPGRANGGHAGGGSLPGPDRQGPLAAFAADLSAARGTLLRSPGFSAVVLAVLALGIGANTAIFSAVDAVLFRPLPFPDPAELVMLWESNTEKGWQRESAAPANYLDWRREVEALEDVAAYEDFDDTAALTGEGEPRQVTVKTVTGNFFSVLGVGPVVGRTLRHEETWSDAPRVAVLSEWFWRQRFGADPGVVGRNLRVDGAPVEVVGVVPSPLRITPEDPALWLPVRWDRADTEATWFRRAHWIRPIGRLADGAGVEEARRQLETVAARLEREHPETNRLMGAGLTPLHEFLVGDRRGPLLVLLGAVGLLLLLACADVANLFLVRTAERRRELAVRAALGAGRGRLVRVLLAEGLLLAVAGGALGILVGFVGIRGLVALQPGELVPADGLRLDLPVLGFTAAVSLGAVLLFALIPALRGARVDLSDALKDGERGGTGRVGRAGGILVAGETALAVMVVAGAALLGRSFAELRDVDPGFRVEDRLTATLSLPGTRYGSGDEIVGFYDALLERVEALPGVRNAAVARSLPLVDSYWTSDFTVQGWPSGRFGAEVLHREVSGDYYRVMGVPLLRGRVFTREDRTDAPEVVLINEALVERHFSGEDPLGRRIAFDREPSERSTWYTVVGVVGNERQTSLRAGARPEIVAPFRQDWSTTMRVVVHGDGDPRGLVGPLRTRVRALDPGLPLFRVRTLEEVFAGSLARERFLLVLLGVFAATALLLATLGIYGVTARSTRRRTREIGVRIALGARRADVVGTVVARGAAAVALGLAVGLGGALALGRTVEGLLYGVSASDPATLAAVAALLGCVGLAASFLPARGATRVDPVRALRSE